jgi:capsular polysaccharide export protein
MSHVLRTPVRVSSSLVQRHLKKTEKPPLFLFGFNAWKTFMKDWFPEYNVVFVPMKLWPIDFEINWKWRILADKRSRVLVWQYKALPNLKQWCRKNGVEFHYVEDGFIRSVSLGALRTPPLSLTFDSQDMFFNANEPTDLETLLRTYDFDANPALVSRARAVIDTLLNTKLSKYNSSASVDISNVYGPKAGKRILVVGQVERDASIQYGCNVSMTNNDLVWLARRENPEAQIIYKPHPEVLQGTADAISNPDLVRGAALVLDTDISLADAFQTIDHVYTITSLSGFEALLRGIPVTTIGCPFYSGWGLTDDRQPNHRRDRKLTLEQLFAAAYMLYPKYIDPQTKRPIEIEDAISVLRVMRDHAPPPPITGAKAPDMTTSGLGDETLDTIRAIRRVIDLIDPPVRTAPEKNKMK